MRERPKTLPQEHPLTMIKHQKDGKYVQIMKNVVLMKGLIFCEEK
jgi:hypothetical protein